MSILTDLELMPEDKQDAAHEVKYINVGQLVPNPDNFYHIGDLSGLKASILADGGVLQNLVVEPRNDGTYMIISGHRRCQAVKELLDEGADVDVDLPCRIETNHDKAEEQLVNLNRTSRVLTPWEDILQVQYVDKIATEKRERGTIQETKRQYMQRVLGMSSGAIARRTAIYHNLITDLQEKMKNGKLGVSVAYELCQLHPEDQQAMLEAHNTFGLEEITLRDVRSYKNMNGTNLRSTEDPRQTNIMDFIGDEPAQEGQEEPEETAPQPEAVEPEAQTAGEAVEAAETEEPNLPEEMPAPVEAELDEEDLEDQEDKEKLDDEENQVSLLKEYQRVARDIHGRLCCLKVLEDQKNNGAISEKKYIDDSQYECNRMYQELDNLRVLCEQMKKSEGKR